MAVYLKKAKERPEQDLRAVSELVREVLERVRLEGEGAVRDYSKKFDHWDPSSFRVSETDMEKAVKTLSPTGTGRYRFLPGPDPQLCPKTAGGHFRF